MSGLIQREEYDRVVRERDDLAERVAWLESDAIVPGDAAVLALVQAFRVPPGRGRFALMLARHAGQVVKHGALLRVARSEASPKILHTYAAEVRRMFWDAGFVGPVVSSMFGEGYQMAPAAAAWLRAKVPDAFPATKEPSR